MAFWSDTTGAEPLRQFRWYMVFGGEGGLDAVKFALKKCDKPKAKINSVQHKYLNHFFNYPGRLEWEDVNVTFAAISDPKISGVLNSIFTASGYQFPKDDTQYRTLGKNDFITQIARNGIQLIQIDPGGIPIETWTIHKPFFTSVQFGALDYSSEEIVEISCTLKYDWATVS